METLRIAHISDLHFSKISFSPTQFFSKRWLGNLNMLLKRRHLFQTEELFALPSFFRQHLIDYVIITGDLSTTGQSQEFAQAKRLVKQFEKEGLKVAVIPGNHDHYTKYGWKKRLFYTFFPNPSMQQQGISCSDLNPFWTLVSLDTAAASSLFSSNGFFHKSLESKLFSLLSSIPQKKQILLINHFPLFEHEQASKILKRSQSLRALLNQFPNVRLYLHGHTHNSCVADLRINQLPIVLDSGSVAQSGRGFWNLIELQPCGAKVQAFEHLYKLREEWHWSFS